VTGAGSGIGRGIARRLAADGFAVAVLDLNGEAAEAVAKEIEAEGDVALAVTCDISTRAAVDDAFRQVRDAFGPTLVLVNNAGMTGFKKFVEITDDEWDLIYRVNVNGTFYCTQNAAKDMLEAGWGRIVMISSSSAQTGSARMVHYSSTKGAMVAMTRSLSQELAPFGITTNTIPPGSIITPMMQDSADKGFLDIEATAKQNPVRRTGTPEDIAAAASFLCRDEAGYITGQIIGVNGGRVP
jgi:NAD(P)-dependent dehydrogenase (short-subunit alcohol dehydrogenase family)